MADQDRRSFLKWVVHGLNGLFAAVLGIPAIAYLIDARNRGARDSGFRPVEGIKLSELTSNEPQQGVIRDIRTDAWTVHPNDVVGRVWVVKLNHEVRVFTTVCPHLGCSINSNSNNGFVCPCHGAEFQCDGTRVERPNYLNPAPRTMDSLEWRSNPTDPDLIQVVYQNFYQGRHQKVPKA